MSEYTPSTAHIRKRFVYSTGWDDKKVPGYSGVAYLREKYAKEFNDWLAEHDRQIAAEAWDEAVDCLSRHWLDRVPKAVDDMEAANPYKEKQ